MSLSPYPAFAPPWDASSWVVFDRCALLANLAARLGPANSLLDLRSPILSMLAPHFEDDWRRLGVGGFLISASHLSRLPSSFYRNWQGILTAPFRSSALSLVARLGLCPIISQVPEAIIWSNMAQQAGKELPLLVRWRGGDLLADSGPTGFLPLVEAIPGLPMLRLDGFFCDTPFASRHQADAFRRAISRTCPESTTPILISGSAGELPARIKPLSTIDDEFLTWTETVEQAATFTVETWGVPVDQTSNQLHLSIDFGSSHGIPDHMELPVLVEDMPGVLYRVEPYRSLIALPHRPEARTPWRVTLVGGNGVQAIGPSLWPRALLRRFIADRLRTVPCYLASANGYELITSAQGAEAT
ncbi:MAG TPA: hypothetical protein PKO06_04190 [Candidatus Ozemobacteraceae bacterium]|nr:hypothetical protein [Candidatus Ozemobacteraceae bacterium]